MRSILPASDAVRQDLIEAHDRLGRLAALETRAQGNGPTVPVRLPPAVFDVILKATEPIGGYSIADDDAEPFCLTCRHPIGVFPATNGPGVTTAATASLRGLNPTKPTIAPPSAGAPRSARPPANPI